MYELSSPGWFKSLNGLPVAHHELPADFMDHGGSWARGRPTQIGIHYTAGCGDDLYSVEIARTYPIIALSVNRLGQWRQYSDLRDPVPWHAFAVSEYAIGIEHCGLPGTCELTDIQWANSERGIAGLLEWVEHRYGHTIPLKHLTTVDRIYHTAEGFWGHVDITPGSSVNPNRHTDTLLGRSWETYLGNIEKQLNATPHPGHPYPGHTLQLKSDEASVLVLKKRLQFLGYKNIKNGPHFGVITDKAVRAFQKKQGLRVDGVVGPFTWRRLWS